MADELQAMRRINWRETFPFTHLFRAFRIAIHPSKLILALAALLAIYFGGRVLDGLWMDKHLAAAHELEVYAMTSGGSELSPTLAAQREFEDFARSIQSMAEDFPDAPEEFASQQRRGIFITFFNYEVMQVNRVVGAVLAGHWLGPAGVISSVVNFFTVGPLWLFKFHPLYAVLFTLWFLIVWALFGGAIARIAAIHVARDEKISVRQALRFSMGKFLSFISAPLIPLLIILGMGVLVAAVGAIFLYIPYVGPILLGLLFFLALLAGFVMTLVLVGTIGGFNLMYPTIAVEGSDSFDAISRSFSYVFARPWRMIFYTAVAVAYGALCYLFVRFFIFILLALTHFFVGWFLGGQPATYWNGLGTAAAIWPAPDPVSLPYNVDYGGLKWSEDAAAGLISFWVYLVIGMLGAFAISFYFSVNTIIYYLMRSEVDATEMDDVYVEQSEEEFSETASSFSSSPSPAPTAASSATTSPPMGTSGTGPLEAGPPTGAMPESRDVPPMPPSSPAPSDQVDENPPSQNSMPPAPPIDEDPSEDETRDRSTS